MLKSTLNAYGVELRPIEEADLPELLAWRNRDDIRLMMKSQDLITMEAHKKWFASIAQKSTADIQNAQHFSICYQSQLIGSANIVANEGGIAGAKIIEPGLYIGNEKYRGNIIAFAPSLVLNDYCFEVLQVQKIVATVHEDNMQAIAYNQKLGYRVTSLDDSSQQQDNSPWVTMNLTLNDYVAATAQIRNFLSRPRRAKETEEK